MGFEGCLLAGDFYYWAETAPLPDGQFQGVVHFTGWRDVDDVIETLDPPQTHTTPDTYRWAGDALEAAHALAKTLVEDGALGIDL
ncbi:hypothetical protein PPN31114_01247 [Pandoraea pneumonica]|jgi:hypothetical protein|uniref:Uncharacterized protein n=1 Tax=Pandoraea pneumonica TaxID=2508299 RepID=A0A5E4T8I6_9BURK|nr:hypothetical protein [Pandoraea pneumonica]VVD83263.1 hypothetical protein PPN31114_01247 [Pandoraea pneumonica]